MKNKNIIAVQNLLRCLDIASLRNFEVVANLVRAFGIVQWGPATFGDDERFKNPSVQMAGIYQIPDQIGKALVYLSDYKINSYLEVGVFQGGNFFFVSEYLRRFNPDIQCLGIDPTKYLNDEIGAIIEKESWLHFNNTATSDDYKQQGFDLVFIDGEHTAEWVKKDWENIGRYSKICMFHDIQGNICPDVVAFWKVLKSNHPGKKISEISDCTSREPTKGIGIIHNA